MISATSKSRVDTKTEAPLDPHDNTHFNLLHLSCVKPNFISSFSFHTSSKTSKYLLLCNNFCTFLSVTSKFRQSYFSSVIDSMMEHKIFWTEKFSETQIHTLMSKFLVT